ADLLGPAAREQPDHRYARIEAESPAGLAALRRVGERVEYRMPDELDPRPRPPIERDLERKHREDERDPPGDGAHAPRPPRPHLGRDEVGDRNAGAPGHARQSQIELG